MAVGWKWSVSRELGRQQGHERSKVPWNFSTMRYKATWMAVKPGQNITWKRCEWLLFSLKANPTYIKASFKICEPCWHVQFTKIQRDWRVLFIVSITDNKKHFKKASPCEAKSASVCKSIKSCKSLNLLKGIVHSKLNFPHLLFNSMSFEPLVTFSQPHGHFWIPQR